MKLYCTVILLGTLSILSAQELALDSVGNSIVEIRPTTGPSTFFASSYLLSTDGAAYFISAISNPVTRFSGYSWKKTGPNTGTLEFQRDSTTTNQLFVTLNSARGGTFRSGSDAGEINFRPFQMSSNAPLRNLSSRSLLAPGQPSLTGFVVAGRAPRRVLVRAIGPSLTQFGVTGPALNPVLTVFKDSAQVASNAGWGGADGLTATFSSVGAFALTPASADCVLALTLNPGAYTAQVRDASGGEILVEVYFIN